jgi:ABC-2 type transport system permease protein
VVSRLNPLTYMVDALRQLMLVEPAGSYSLGLSLSIWWASLRC